MNWLVAFQVATGIVAFVVWLVVSLIVYDTMWWRFGQKAIRWFFVAFVLSVSLALFAIAP